MQTLLSIVLLLILIAGVGASIYLLRNYVRKLKESWNGAHSPTKCTSKDALLYPAGAVEIGSSDMFKAILGKVYLINSNRDLDQKIFIQTSKDPVFELAELVFNNTRRTVLYDSFDPSEGRTSREYMGSTDIQLFEQYVHGGRILLDKFDDTLTELYRRKRLQQVREEGLKDVDYTYTKAREELKKLRDKSYTSKTDFDHFDNKMKELNEGKAINNDK